VVRRSSCPSRWSAALAISSSRSFPPPFIGVVWRSVDGPRRLHAGAPACCRLERRWAGAAGSLTGPTSAPTAGRGPWWPPRPGPQPLFGSHGPSLEPRTAVLHYRFRAGHNTRTSCTSTSRRGLVVRSPRGRPGRVSLPPRSRPWPRAGEGRMRRDESRPAAVSIPTDISVRAHRSRAHSVGTWPAPSPRLHLRAWRFRTVVGTIPSLEPSICYTAVRRGRPRVCRVGSAWGGGCCSPRWRTPLHTVPKSLRPRWTNSFLSAGSTWVWAWLPPAEYPRLRALRRAPAAAVLREGVILRIGLCDR
jgi:hypothetical protein